MLSKEKLRAGAEIRVEAGAEGHEAEGYGGPEQRFGRWAHDPIARNFSDQEQFHGANSYEAEALLDELAMKQPDAAWIRFELANLKQSRGDHASAIVDFRHILTLEPAHFCAMIGLSQSLLATGQASEAVDIASAAIKHAPIDAAPFMAMADALFALGWPREAAIAYAKAVERAPEAAAPYAGLAQAQLKLNEIEPARANAERALAHDQTIANAWYVLGMTLHAMGQQDGAVATLEQSITLDPSNAAAHLGLGLVYLNIDRDHDGSRHFLRSVELDPRNKEAHIGLSTICYRAGRSAEAMVHAQRALEIDPQLMSAHQCLARLFAEEGRSKEAKIHRDLAYEGRSLVTISASCSQRSVLVLTTTTDGNTPDRYLLPAARYTRHFWFIEYASLTAMETLPPYDVVFNAIADCDLAGAAARNVERFMQVNKTRLINNPSRIAETRRHLTPVLLADIDNVVIPKTIRVTADEAKEGVGAAAQRAGLALPFLVRPIGSHGGEGLIKVENEDDTSLQIPTQPVDHYLTSFHDFRSADGYYRKYRIFFIDRCPFPYHLAISSHWMVHHETSGMSGDSARFAEELRFLEDPESAIGSKAMHAVRAIGERIDLDFCGLDFSVLADGCVLVFEANATMLVHPEAPEGPFARKNPSIERILKAFHGMLVGNGAKSN